MLTDAWPYRPIALGGGCHRGCAGQRRRGGGVQGGRQGDGEVPARVGRVERAGFALEPLVTRVVCRLRTRFGAAPGMRSC
jgi:hypothetical protein